jgi:hypothetical protein
MTILTGLTGLLEAVLDGDGAADAEEADRARRLRASRLRASGQGRHSAPLKRALLV